MVTASAALFCFVFYYDLGFIFFATKNICNIKDKEKMKLCLLLLFCRNLLADKQSVKFFVTGSSGVPNIPEFMGAVVCNGIQVGYCDSNKTLKPKQDWAKKILETNPELKEWYTHMCFNDQPNFFKEKIYMLKQQFSQSEGVHIVQRISGCERDENTGEVTGLTQYGYNGEDFLEFNLKTKTWIALKPEADIIKLRWDAVKVKIKDNEIFLTQICPEWIKMCVDNGKSFLRRTVLPSVSLLQKTLSSPVSCHATGFYPDKAMMFWRKDGEELHEGVAPGEILPNNDETFQMSVDLNVSSVTPEDWSRYDCVFQLSDSEDVIITRLNETVIRTNRGGKNTNEEPSDMMITITAAVVVSVALVLVAAVFAAVYKKKKETNTEQSRDNAYDLSTRLNAETA